MTQTSSEVVVGANGSIYVAPLTSTEPSDSTDTLDAAWVELGYASEDGVRIADAKDIENIGAWQSFYPLRRIVTGRDFTLNFTLRQWNPDTVALAFGGGEVTGGAGEYKYSPPTPETLDERAMLIEWADGDKHYRVVVPKGLVTENVESQVARSQAADLPVTFSVTPESSEDDPWYLLTDDPSFGS